MFKKFIPTLFLISFFQVTILFAQDIVFPEWQEGVLELHHISTGRGDAAFYILPDGTTLLIDAGDMSETHPRTLSLRNVSRLPNVSKTAPEWIVDYIDQFIPKKNPIQLDYALITHFHDDHFGEMDVNRKIDKQKGYALTGITQVGNLIPIKTLLDRGYTFPINLKDTIVQKKISKDDDYQMMNTLKNYWKFIDYHTENQGMKYETLVAGRNNQIELKKSPQKFTNFQIQNIAVNGKIWTGVKQDYYDVFKEGEYPGENSLSACLKITYGKFDYVTNGDISGVNSYGDSDFNSIESQIAPVIGSVDVATLNHHGNRDSQNNFYVRTLRPRVWIGQTWSSDHPDNNVLRRLLSEKIYPTERDLFATAMLQSNKEVIGGLIDKYKSLSGHIVVRVFDNGNKYEVYVLDENSEKREVKAKFGTYESK